MIILTLCKYNIRTVEFPDRQVLNFDTEDLLDFESLEDLTRWLNDL